MEIMDLITRLIVIIVLIYIGIVLNTLNNNIYKTGVRLSWALEYLERVKRNAEPAPDASNNKEK